MKLLRVLVVLFIFLGAASPANAQMASDLPRGNVSGFGSLALSASDGLDNGRGGGASGAYFFSRDLGVEGGFSLRTFDMAATDDNQLSGGELTTNVFNVNVVGRFGTGSMQPYVSGGVAFIMTDYTIDPTVGSRLVQFGFTPAESVEDTIGFNFAGGVDVRFSERLGAFVEGRYIVAKADTVGGLTDQFTNITATTAGEQQINAFTVNGGIRILF